MVVIVLSTLQGLHTLGRASVTEAEYIPLPPAGEGIFCQPLEGGQAAPGGPGATEPRVAFRLAPVNFSGLRICLPPTASSRRILRYCGVQCRIRPAPWFLPRTAPWHEPESPGWRSVCACSVAPDRFRPRRDRSRCRCRSDTLTRMGLGDRLTHPAVRSVVSGPPGEAARSPTLRPGCPRRGALPFVRSPNLVSPADPPAPKNRSGWLECPLRSIHSGSRCQAVRPFNSIRGVCWLNTSDGGHLGARGRAVSTRNHEIPTRIPRKVEKSPAGPALSTARPPGRPPASN